MGVRSDSCIDFAQHPLHPSRILRRDHQDLKPVIGAFHGDAGRIVHMKIDAESGRKFRWSPQTDRPLVPVQVDDAIDRNPETGEPGFQILRRAARRRIEPNLATSSDQSGHEGPGTTAEPFGVSPATPPGNVLFGGNGGVTNQGIVDIERDSHATTIFVYCVCKLGNRITIDTSLAQTGGARRRVRSINQAWVPVAAGPVASSAGWLRT